MCQEILSRDAASLGGRDGGDGPTWPDSLLAARKARAVEEKRLLHVHVSISAGLGS